MGGNDGKGDEAGDEATHLTRRSNRDSSRRYSLPTLESTESWSFSM